MYALAPATSVQSSVTFVPVPNGTKVFFGTTRHCFSCRLIDAINTGGGTRIVCGSPKNSSAVEKLTHNNDI